MNEEAINRGHNECRVIVSFNHENQKHREEQIGATNYSLLTVPPGIWFGFQGISDSDSMILNLANLPHDPAEVERKMKEEVHFKWREDS